MAAQCASCGSPLGANEQFCPHCGAPSSGGVQPQRRTPAPQPDIRMPSLASTAKPMSRKMRFGLAAVAVCLVAGMVYVFSQNIPGGDNTVIEQQPRVVDPPATEGTHYTMTPVAARVDGGDIVISERDVIQHHLVSFGYTGAKQDFTLMAYINPDGRLVTAIAISEPCNSHSFHTESGALVCDDCGTRWNLTTLAGISGTCQKYAPPPIPSRISNGEVRIPVKLVEGWKMRI